MAGITALTFRALFAGICLLILKKIWDHFRSPLRNFDGPFLAKFTDLWRLLDVKKRRCDITHNELHQKYGVAVRMGPNTISLSDPGLIKVVYTHKPRWKKSTMYNVNDALVNGVRIPNFNSMIDEDMHDKTIKPIRAIYTMTNVKSFEQLMDHAIIKFLQALETRFMDEPNVGMPFDASNWVNYAAWDIMSEITFGKPFGFLSEGRDVGGFLATSKYGLDYFSVICQMPWLDYLFDKNPVKRIGAPSFSWAVDFSVKALIERYQQLATNAEKQKEITNQDFLAKFLDIKAADPDSIDDNMVVNFLLINVLAGSDTTAITLGASIYYLLKYPAAHARLTEELTKANLSMPVTWNETLALPYLNAVLQEVMRIHGGVGLMLERVVPAGGFTLPDGRFIPEGTTVGMNPWVVHNSEEYFGPDTDKFIPERWLKRDNETEVQFEARDKRMKEATLTFGHGPRICLGRNLSRLEANKVIATLFRYYELSLADPNENWVVHNAWFTYQRNINIRIRRRDQRSG